MHLHVHPVGNVFRIVSSISPESVFPLRIGAMPKHEPSAGTKAVVMGRPWLQPVPV